MNFTLGGKGGGGKFPTPFPETGLWFGGTEGAIPAGEIHKALFSLRCTIFKLYFYFYFHPFFLRRQPEKKKTTNFPSVAASGGVTVNFFFFFFSFARAQIILAPRREVPLAQQSRSLAWLACVGLLHFPPGRWQETRVEKSKRRQAKEWKQSTNIDPNE